MQDVLRSHVTIQNKYGLHARPACMFVQTTEKFDADIQVIKSDMQVSGRSIMGLLMLAAAKGSQIEIVSCGNEAPVAMSALIELIERKFDEE